MASIFDDMMFREIVAANSASDNFIEYHPVSIYEIPVGEHFVKAIMLFCEKCFGSYELAVTLADRGLFEFACDCGHYQIFNVYEIPK